MLKHRIFADRNFIRLKMIISMWPDVNSLIQLIPIFLIYPKKLLKVLSISVLLTRLRAKLSPIMLRSMIERFINLLKDFFFFKIEIIDL